MTVIRSGRGEDRLGHVREVESAIREFVRKDAAQVGKRELDPDEFGAGNLNSLIQRVSGTSVMEIDKLITELQMLRDHLQNEGQRVQQEIAEYAHMSQAAAMSTKSIVESLAQWKHTVESNRGARG
jgi:hypothetical protein